MRFEITEWLPNKQVGIDMDAGRVSVTLEFTLKDCRGLRKKLDEAIAGLEADAEERVLHG